MLEVHDVPNSRGLFQDVPEFRQQLMTANVDQELQIIKISTVVSLLFKVLHFIVAKP